MEKPVLIPAEPILLTQDATLKSDPFSYTSQNSLVNSVRDAWASFSKRRAALGLSNPGTVENVSREVSKDVFLNNYMFSGLRADLTKAFSTSPLFQTAHNFTMGAQGMPPYTFAALYGSPRIFCQGNIDNDFQLSARFNYRWTPSLITKSNVQVAPGGAGQAMVQLETDYSGADFSANIKAMNPSILEGNLTGIFVGSYMQSVTPRIALGMETVWQRAGGGQGPDIVTSYAARYKGSDWIASAQLLQQGGVQTSYWKRLAERVEAGVDVNLSFLGRIGAGSGMMGGTSKNDGVATIGVKYDFRSSVFRGQVDSQGKVACLLEKRLAPAVQITFAGELDHSKNTAKIGLALSLESPGDELLEQQEKMAAAEVVTPPF